MSATTEHHEARDTAGLARACGVLLALGSLSAAVLLAGSLSALGVGRASQCASFAAAALLVRAVVSLGVETVISARQRRARATWYARAAAWLMRGRLEDLHAVEVAVSQISEEPSLVVTATAAATATLGLIVVALAGGWLCVLIIIGLAALSVPVYIRVGRQSVALMADFHRRRGVLVSRQVRLLRSITDLRALGAVPYGADEIAAASTAENRAVISGVRVTIRSTLVTEFLGGVSVGLVAMVVGLRLWHHSIALFPALLSVLVTAEMFSWLRRFGGEFHRRDDANAAREHLSSYATLDAPSPATTSLVELTDVETEAPSQPVSLVVRAGERLRITGPSGIGKSALLDVALGLREPTSGRVRRADVRVGLVRVDSHFVPGTIRDNMTLGVHRDDGALRELLDELACPARLFDLDSVLGDDASTLSSGERVHLALVRALLAGVSLLVMDDVAGVLDPTSRRAIARTLEQRPDLTVIEAAHDVVLVESVTAQVELVRS